MMKKPKNTDDHELQMGIFISQVGDDRLAVWKVTKMELQLRKWSCQPNRFVDRSVIT